MVKNIILFVIILLLFNNLQAQKNKTFRVKVEDQIEVDRNESLEQTKYRLIKLLQRKAIEEKFGSNFYSGSSLRIESTNQDGEASGKETYKTITNSYAKGIWVETIKKHFETIHVDERGRQETWLHCTLEGRIMEITEAQYDLVTEPMSCLLQGCERTDFRNENEFYLKFQSPVDGYVSVYLDLTQDDIVQFLLPSHSAFAEVQADQEVVLFKNANYEMYTERDQELDVLYVIFSEHPFAKPILRAGRAANEEERSEGISFPRELNRRNFEQWLGRIRTQYKGVQVEEIPITITRYN
ncbi:MAG: hypothetical protein AAF847_01055 [Bacteroidota bacterium]